MTIRFLNDWNGYKAGQTRTLSAAEETAALGARVAVDAVAAPASPVEVRFDPATGSLLGPDGKPVSAVSGAGNVLPAVSYIAMIPGNQAAGSGPAKNAVKGALLADMYPSALTGDGTLSDAEMWANRGWMTTVASTGAATTGKQIVLPLAAFNVNLAQRVIAVALNIKAAAPAAQTAFAGNGNGGPTIQGFNLAARTDGKISISYWSSAGGIALPATNGVFFDGTEHSLLFVICPSGHVFVYRDGELDTSYSPLESRILGTTTATVPFVLGGGAGASRPSMDGQWRGLHLLSFDRVPINLGWIAKRLFSEPVRQLDLNDVLLPNYVVGLFWAAGQSNENGSGNTQGVTGSLGVPWLDGATRSIIPGLSHRLALRNVAGLWAQTARGSTALTDSWCGRIRNWVSGMTIVTGSYVLNAGTLYKCTNAASFAAASTTVPAAGTGADTVTWTSLGAPTADDTATLAGTGVYGPTSPRWDPNGLLATALTRAQLMRSSVSRLVGLISLGQGDRYVASSAAAFSDAIQKVALYYLANGVDSVGICMTVRSAVGAGDLSAANGGGAANAANATPDGWYNANLIPGRAAALAALAGNPKVFAGHDWATAVGPVTAQTSPIAVGVKSADNVHATDAAYETLMVPETDRALLAAGI